MFCCDFDMMSSWNRHKDFSSSYCGKNKKINANSATILKMMAKMVLSEHWAKHCPLLSSQWLKCSIFRLHYFLPKAVY